jgi:hypothetical protein
VRTGRHRAPAALYRLVALDRFQEQVLTLRLAPGVSGYAFTFG